MAELDNQVPEFERYFDSMMGDKASSMGEEVTPISVPEAAPVEQEETTEFENYFDTQIKREQPPVPSETEQALTPKFDYGAPIQARDEDSDGTLTIKALSEDENFMNKVETYYTNRVEQGARLEGETNQEYLERFMSNHYRAFMYNDVYLVDQLAYLKDADHDTKLLFGDVFSTIDQKAPDLFSDEMDNLDRLQAVGDAIWYGGTSVSNVLTILGSGALGTLAAPGAGTAAGVAAGVTAVRAASTSAIRNFLVKNVAVKPMARATVISGGLSAADDAMRQNVERIGRIDPSTGQYDPTVDPNELELDYTRMGIATGIGVLSGVPEGVAASRKIAKFNKTRETNFNNIKQAQKDFNKTTDSVDAVTSSPSTGQYDEATIALADAADKALKRAKVEPLMDKVVKDFVLIDNVPEEYQRKAIDALQRAEVFESIGRVSIQLQKDLDRIGMLDVLGESAEATYRGLLPSGKTRPTRITAAISDGLNGIENLFGGKFARELTQEQEKEVLAVLDESIAKSDISKKDFMTFMSYYTNGAVSAGDITRKSMNTGATLMNSASRLKRDFFGDVYPNVDPEMRKILDNYLENKKSKVMEAVFTAGGAIKTLDRVRVASLTSQLVTTSRNIMSGGMMVAGQTGVNFIDSAMYQIGRGLQNAAQGNFSKAGVAKGIKDIWSDSASVIYGVMNTTKSQTLIDATMEYTPALHRQLIRNQPDMFASGKDKFARAANGYIETLNHFNMASDSFFRRAFYMSSLDKRFKKFLREYEAKHGSPYAGGQINNVMDFVESGRILDKKLIAGATEDALKMTFAANPELKPAKAFLSFMETTRPVSSIVMPFPRFFVNSLRTMYEYSPANAASKMFHGMANAETKDLPVLQKVQGVAKGAFGDAQREAYAKAAIGTSTMAFMVNYLANKEDNTPWYDMGGVDIRAMWPLSSYAAAAEFLIDADNFLGTNIIQEKVPRNRSTQDRKMYLETMSGFPVRSGENVNRLLEGFSTLATGFEWDSTAAQKNNDRLSEFSAEYLGGFLTPLKMFKDVAEQVAVENTQKDIRAGIEDESFTTKLTARAVNSYLPENIFGYDVQEPAPTRKYLLDNAEKMRKSPIARFVGITYSQKNSKLELEMQRIGIKRGDMLPYTGSSRLDNRQAKYFGHYAVEGFRDLFGSEEYNSDVNELGVKMTQQEKLNRQRSLVKQRTKQYRGYTKDAANNEAAQEADAKASAMRVVIEKLKRENASTEELSDAYSQLAEFELYHLTNDEMKVRWDKKSSEADASSIERLFQQKHLEAIDKANRGELLSSIDYLFLRGDSIVEQRSYGLALSALDSMLEMREQASFGTR